MGMDDSHQHKTYLVTGGAKRVGAAIVRCLHAAGGNLLIHYGRSRSEAEALATELNRARPHSAQAHGLDLSGVDGMEALVGAALGAQAGENRIREVVTSGGFSHFRRATQTPFNLVFEAKP